MNYAWDAALSAEEQDIEQGRLRFVPARNASPYIEVAFENLNQMLIEDFHIEINFLYRFNAVFNELLSINMETYPALRETLFDVMMHYFVRLDLREGLCRTEYYLRFILRDIIAGVYGRDQAAAAGNFTGKQMKSVLMCMLTLFNTGPSIHLFRKVMRAVYPLSLVYSNNDIYRELLIYIGCRETAREREKIQFLISVFLSINYTTHLYWEHHFGIIDVDVTMMLDEMVIF